MSSIKASGQNYKGFERFPSRLARGLVAFSHIWHLIDPIGGVGGVL